MKFSLVHPSRNRLERCEEAIKNWTKNFAYQNDDTYEYILSCDISDSKIDEYRDLAKKYGANITINDNTCCVDAVNEGGKVANGDIIILVSDDFHCFYGWNIALKRYYIENTPQLYQVWDGITKDIITIPIMTKEAYKMLGYIYYPEYKSMFADNDLRLEAERLEILVDATLLHFPHLHWSNGLAQKDEQYEWQEKSENWKIGSALFEKRKEEMFRNLGLNKRFN
jgi:hypothetical protein